MTTNDLRDKVFNFTSEKDLFSKDCHVLVGLSGGADSMTLLHMLTNWETPIRVSAIHIHHGLRGEWADRDEGFVREYCEKNAIPLTVVRADVAILAKTTHMSLEEAGRCVRYEHFEATRRAIGADYVLTAHTADDQTETVLMHLVRGCGIDGLTGIPFARGNIRRPLLCCTRAEIEAYCARCSLPYVTDESNTDIRYMRNNIRHRFLPLLEEINPSVDRALLRLRKHAADDVEYLNQQAETALSAARCDEGFSAETMLAHHAAIRRRMIRLMLRDAHISLIEEAHILAADEAISHRNGLVSLPDGYIFSVEQGVVSVRKEAPPPDVEPIAVDLIPSVVRFGDFDCVLRSSATDNENVHKLFLQSAIDCDKIVGKLCIRHRLVGDYLHPVGRRVGKSLKKLMNEWHIPAHIRETYPLLCDEEGVVLVPGYACDERVRVTDATKHYLVCEIGKVSG